MLENKTDGLRSAISRRSICDRKLEAGRGLNGGFTASKLERSLARLGHEQPFAFSTEQPFRLPLYSDSCRKTCGCNPALCGAPH